MLPLASKSKSVGGTIGLHGHDTSTHTRRNMTNMIRFTESCIITTRLTYFLTNRLSLLINQIPFLLVNKFFFFYKYR